MDYWHKGWARLPQLQVWTDPELFSNQNNVLKAIIIPVHQDIIRSHVRHQQVLLLIGGVDELDPVHGLLPQQGPLSVDQVHHHTLARPEDLYGGCWRSVIEYESE